MYHILREKKQLFIVDERTKMCNIFIYKDGVWRIDNESIPVTGFDTIYIGENPFSTNEHFFDDCKPIENVPKLNKPSASEDEIIIYNVKNRFYKYDCGSYYELGRCIYDDDCGDIIVLNKVDTIPEEKTISWKGTQQEFDSLKYDALSINSTKTIIKIDKKHFMTVKDNKIYILKNNTKSTSKRKICTLAGVLAYLLNRHPKIKERLAFKQKLFLANIIVKAKTKSGYQITKEYGRYNMFWNSVENVEKMRNFL